MSRSNQTDLINPAVRYFDWSGKTGAVNYYDKEKEERVNVKLPFKFLILDRVSQITGGMKRNGKYEGFWSNAVKNLKTQPFTVRSKQGVEAQGFYSQIKDTRGVKFMTGLYIAFYDSDKNLQIGYLKIKGAALNAWINFTKSHKNIYEGAFAVKERSDELTNGDTTYFEPIFEHNSKVSDEADEMAKELDVHLQEYLTAYFAQQGLAQVEAEYSGGTNVTTDDDHGDAWEPTDEEAPDDEAF